MADHTRSLVNYASDFQAIACGLATLQGAGILKDDEAYRLLVGAGMIDDVRKKPETALDMGLLLEIWNHGFGSGVDYVQKDTKRCAEDDILAILAEWKVKP